MYIQHVVFHFIMEVKTPTDRSRHLDNVQLLSEASGKLRMAKSCLLTPCFSSTQLHHTGCMRHHLRQIHLYHHSIPYIAHLQPCFLTEAASLMSVPSHYHQSPELCSQLRCHVHQHVTDLHL